MPVSLPSSRLDKACLEIGLRGGLGRSQGVIFYGLETFPLVKGLGGVLSLKAVLCSMSYVLEITCVPFVQHCLIRLLMILSHCTVYDAN